MWHSQVTCIGTRNPSSPLNCCIERRGNAKDTRLCTQQECEVAEPFEPVHSLQTAVTAYLHFNCDQDAKKLVSSVVMATAYVIN